MFSADDGADNWPDSRPGWFLNAQPAGFRRFDTMPAAGRQVFRYLPGSGRFSVCRLLPGRQRHRCRWLVLWAAEVSRVPGPINPEGRVGCNLGFPKDERIKDRAGEECGQKGSVIRDFDCNQRIVPLETGDQPAV